MTNQPTAPAPDLAANRWEIREQREGHPWPCVVVDEGGVSALALLADRTPVPRSRAVAEVILEALNQHARGDQPDTLRDVLAEVIAAEPGRLSDLGQGGGTREARAVRRAGWISPGEHAAAVGTALTRQAQAVLEKLHGIEWDGWTGEAHLRARVRSALLPSATDASRSSGAQALRDAAEAARGMAEPTSPDCAEWADWLDARASRLEVDG